MTKRSIPSTRSRKELAPAGATENYGTEKSATEKIATENYATENSATERSARESPEKRKAGAQARPPSEFLPIL